MLLLILMQIILLLIRLKFKKLIGQTGNNSTKDVEIMVPLKYLSNSWETREMSLINCEINLILTGLKIAL